MGVGVGVRLTQFHQEVDSLGRTWGSKTAVVVYVELSASEFDAPLTTWAAPVSESSICFGAGCVDEAKDELVQGASPTPGSPNRVNGLEGDQRVSKTEIPNMSDLHLLVKKLENQTFTRAH